MNFGKCGLLIFVWSSLLTHCDVSLKPHEIWWEKNIDTMMPFFVQWKGDISSSSRVKAREHIRMQGYKTILDIPCGLATDFFGFRRDVPDIQYLGMDITPKLVKLARENNIPVRRGSIEDIPSPDLSFDVCYARHILEHLAYYEKAISELIRVAKYEALIVFFIKPTDESDNFILNFDHDCLLYHNHYNRKKLENFVLNNFRTKYFEWEDVNEKEVLFHIYLK